MTPAYDPNERPARPLAQCIACTGPTTTLGARVGYTYVACTHCGGVQLDPLPAQGELERAYSDESFSEGYFDPTELRARYGPYYELVADLVAATPRPAGPVLDFGCGWGGVGERLHARGIEQLSIDLSAHSVAACRARGLRAEVGDLALFEGRAAVFSAITAAFVFEHIVRFDLLLADIRRLLLSGGLVVVLIPTSNLVRPLSTILRRVRPDSDLPAFDKTLTPPWHTVVFSPRGLVELMRRHGFELVRIEVSPTSAAVGLGKLARMLLSPAMKLGRRVFGPDFPLALGHAFVFRVAQEYGGSTAIRACSGE